MKTTIILIRHGLTDWNLERRWQGHLDVPLNSTGKAQAQALSQRLVGWPIQALYCSDLQRAAQTASILGSTLGLESISKRTWRERDVGAFQGLTRKNIIVQYPELFHKMKEGVINPPGGENNHDLYARAAAAFEELIAAHPGEMIALVSHGAILHTTLLYVLGLPLGEYGRISLSGNTGISIVESSKGRMRLTRLNDTSHLEKAPIPAAI